MAGTGNNMKNMTAFHITWILVGCIFAEAASLWLSDFTLLFKDIVINLVAAVISGAIYWAITPRRYNRRSLSTFN